MSAPELRAQAEEIATRISTTQFFLNKARLEINEIAQELLALDIGGSRSRHVASSNRLLPIVVSELSQLTLDLSLIDSEIRQYRDSL